jgi:molybdopterin converting factor small subunit
LHSEAPLHGSQLLAAFFDRFNELEGLRAVTRLAVNRAFTATDPLLDTADELALIPPVSGG